MKGLGKVRLLGMAAAAALAGAGVGIPVQAGAAGAAPSAAAASGISATPSSSWGVFEPCASNPSENCAAIYSVTNVGGTVYIGGEFTELISPNGTQTLPYHDLAAINESTGTPDTSFASHTFNGTVDVVTPSPTGSELYVGGQFTTVDGSATGADHIAAFNAGTGANLDYAGNTTGPVYALLATGSDLYVGGEFVRADGKARDFAAKLNASTGRLVYAFNADLAYSGPRSPCPTRYGCRGSVRTFLLGTDGSGASTLYIGGHFSTIGGAAHQAIGAVNPTTGAVDSSFDPVVQAQSASGGVDPLETITQVEQTSDGIVAGQAGHLNRMYLFNLAGGAVWTDVPSGDVQTIAVDGSYVYAGGHFNCWCVGPNSPPPSGAQQRIHLARVSLATGALDSTWAPFFGPWNSPYYFGVWALRVVNGDLWAGGVGIYVTVNGKKYQAPKLAVFR